MRRGEGTFLWRRFVIVSPEHQKLKNKKNWKKEPNVTNYLGVIIDTYPTSGKRWVFGSGSHTNWLCRVKFGSVKLSLAPTFQLAPAGSCNFIGQNVKKCGSPS